MTIFEKRDAYRKRIEKLYAELPEIEKRFFDETELAQAALRGGETQEFFEHSRNAATADKQRKEIESLPANGSGVSADEVEKAWNGREAAETFRISKEYEFDAVLMDVQMPEMDGCEAAAAIRTMRRADAKTVPIIAVTANAFAEDLSATQAAGMNAHISKPIDFQLLGKILLELT